MPMINIEYDDGKIPERDIKTFSKAIQGIVSEGTGIEDVFVYANSAKVKVKIAPIEVFVRMTAEKIKDKDALIADIKSRVMKWKDSNSFKHPINLTLIPMNWNVEIGI